MVRERTLILSFDGIGGLAGLLHRLGLDTHFLHVLVDTVQDAEFCTAAVQIAKEFLKFSLPEIRKDALKDMKNLISLQAKAFTCFGMIIVK